MLPDFNAQIENLQDEIHMLKFDRDYWQEQAKIADSYIRHIEQYGMYEPDSAEGE